MLFNKTSKQAQTPAALRLSDRAMRLQKLRAYYLGCQYDHRPYSWDGSLMENSPYATAPYTPPGWNDVSGTAPLDQRRPTIQSMEARAIVDAFSSALFGSGRAPSARVPDAPKLESFLADLIERLSLWDKMEEARSIGGSCGTAVIVFKPDGEAPCGIRVDVLEPAYCTPLHKDGKFIGIDYVYAAEKIKLDPDEPTVYEWFRRSVIKGLDLEWSGVPTMGDEPEWESVPTTAEVTTGLDFPCCVWIKNLRSGSNDLDGESDIPFAALGLLDALDALSSQAFKGTIANCDPTVVINTAEPLSHVTMGSDQAIKLDPSGRVSYAEFTGAGIAAARAEREDLRKRVYELAGYVPPANDVGGRTAYEVSKLQAPMLAKIAKLRSVYGQAVKDLLAKMLHMLAIEAGYPGPLKRNPDLPGNGFLPDEVSAFMRGELQLRLAWPDLTPPTPDELVQRTNVLLSARRERLVSLEDAAREFLDLLPGVKDKGEALQRVLAESSVPEGWEDFGGYSGASTALLNRRYAPQGVPRPNPNGKPPIQIGARPEDDLED